MLPAPVRRCPAARLSTAHTEPIADLWRSLRGYDTTGLLSGLTGLEDHVEIVTGERDDMIPLSQTLQLARELPHARLHTPVPQARHRLPTDKYGHAPVTALLTRMCESSLPSPVTISASSSKVG